jgi:hypothetical protein
LFCSISATTAFADVQILSSFGGEVGPYLRLFGLLAQSGECTAIDGPCFSACTLVLSTIPQDRICVTPRAIPGFHTARLVDESDQVYPAPYATRVVIDTYPGAVRAWIKRRGGLTSRPILLRGRELTAIYPRCR